MNRADGINDIKQMILYEDGDILVCHKVAGLPVQSAGVGMKDMESILKNYLKEKQQERKEGFDRSDSQKVPYLGIVHRLDQPVEGILVFAKNKKAAAGLSRQISGGMLKKVYTAVCCVDNVSESGDKIRNLSTGSGMGFGSDSAADVPESGKNPETGKEESDGKKEGIKEIHLTDWMRKEARINTSAIVSPDMPGAKRAELKYRILQRQTIFGKEYALVQIHLLTGRHHQIRVQMANAGLPLYGDRKYNARWQEYRIPEYDETFGTRLMLCASELTFRHPETRKEMKFKVTPVTVQTRPKHLLLRP